MGVTTPITNCIINRVPSRMNQNPPFPFAELCWLYPAFQRRVPDPLLTRGAQHEHPNHPRPTQNLIYPLPSLFHHSPGFMRSIHTCSYIEPVKSLRGQNVHREYSNPVGTVENVTMTMNATQKATQSLPDVISVVDVISTKHPVPAPSEPPTKTRPAEAKKYSHRTIKPRLYVPLSNAPPPKYQV